MALSNNNSDNLSKGTAFTFSVNCTECQFSDNKGKCVYIRCPFMELPKPSQTTLQQECKICNSIFERSIFSTKDICDDCLSILAKIVKEKENK